MFLFVYRFCVHIILLRVLATFLQVAFGDFPFSLRFFLLILRFFHFVCIWYGAFLFAQFILVGGSCAVAVVPVPLAPLLSLLELLAVKRLGFFYD